MMTKAAGDMPRVLGYGRLSFDDPDRKTSSVADQEAGARRYAERQGWLLTRFHRDEGITGATMERPGLQTLLAAVRARQVDIVVIEDVAGAVARSSS